MIIIRVTRLKRKVRENNYNVFNYNFILDNKISNVKYIIIFRNVKQ